MAISLEHEQGNVYRIDMSGVLKRPDLDWCQDRLAGEIARVGSVRLLFVLDQFDGWDPDATWNDLTFYVTHGSSIERIAIVGPERWRDLALMFAGADLRKAPVEFFGDSAEPEARTWLSS
ncbi:MAG TPA: STAS/SEC14 domain-containing protein, partial [Vicinamibacterales bacterium]|nr:STAS/SEC14 domain-containing protein [Vicinamibacterales bacterium]